jgi:hypothetical protein
MSAKITSTEQLKDYSNAQLVEFYNKLTDENVKRFSTRDAGLKRIQAALEANTKLGKPHTVPEVGEDLAPAPAGLPKYKDTAKDAEAALPKPGFKVYDIQPKASGILPHRPGTIRDTLIKVLSKDGAKYEELGAKTNTDQARGFRNDILRLHSELGWGIKTNAEGVISIYAHND